jgi:hypothetical protein
MGTVLKRLSRGKLYKAKGDSPNPVHSYHMALRTVRQEARPRERQPKMLKTKLAKGEPSGSSPVRSDGSHDGQAGGWTMLMVVKGTHGESWKTILGSKGPNQRQA